MDKLNQPPFDIEARRSELERKSLDMGIDQAYISELVETFYERVRADDVLGPIFEREIGNDWQPHLAKMKTFWQSLSLYDGSYTGKPVRAHTRLRGVQPEHFDVWLELFTTTLSETAPSAEAAGCLLGRAENIAESLKLAMFGSPGLLARALRLDSGGPTFPLEPKTD